MLCRVYCNVLRSGFLLLRIFDLKCQEDDRRDSEVKHSLCCVDGTGLGLWSGAGFDISDARSSGSPAQPLFFIYIYIYFACVTALSVAEMIQRR
jgi:hypothetical protein